MQAGSMSRNLCPSVTDGNYYVSQSNSLRGKNALDSLNMAKLNIDDSRRSTSVKPSTNAQMLPSGSSLGNTGQLSQSRVHARGTPIPGQKDYQSAPQQNQVNRVSPQMQVNAVQRSPVQGWAQSSVQVAVQQLGQHPGFGSQASSPPKTAMSVNSNESGEVDSSETSRSKDALVSKGKNSVQGAGRGSFMYNGAQIMGATGNIAVHNGDQNCPAFLPGKAFYTINSLVYTLIF